MRFRPIRRRRRRRYRKRRWGWRRRYYRHHYRRRPWRRWRVRRWRRSVFRRGGRRARPYRISAFNPRVMRRVVIQGWWPLLQCLPGQEHLRYRPLNWDIEKQWVVTEGKAPDTMGYLVQYGGGWGSGQITLEDLFNEHMKWRNMWSKSNDGMDLVRYFGCKIYLYPLEDKDYWFWWDTDFKHQYEDKIKEYCQPSVMLMAKRTKIVVARQRAQHRRRVKKIFIPPPSRDTTQWKFQTEFCKQPLFTWAAGLIELMTPFDFNGGFRNAWWLEPRNDIGEMNYITLWGRVPPQGDSDLPDPNIFKNDSAQQNVNYQVQSGKEKNIYPIIAYIQQENQKPVINWCVCYNKTLDRWRRAQASTLNISNLRGLCVRELSRQEMTYIWKQGEFRKEYHDRWGYGTYFATIDGRKGEKNPTVQVWNFNERITTDTNHILKFAFNISKSNQNMTDEDFGKLGLPKSPHDLDFGHKNRFGPFVVKNEPVEFQLRPERATNVWVRYKFFFQFGGEYQPPTGIRDPCADNPAYPVPQSGGVTHPLFAGTGGITAQVGPSGLTSRTIRALCSSPPRAETSQCAFLGGDRPKKEEREKAEETTSESSITSAESSTEGDGSTDEEERRERRRRRRKRQLKLFYQRLTDRYLEHKRRRLSE
uniref:Capsid protein n=1 Tax=Torque teno sus virus 1b TaxID=687387 RepID=A0A385FPM8_9VIRU|nr:ORF1 [Torque teno sus virus 1b]